MKKTLYDITFLIELAKSFDGECLSDTFTTMSDKYHWRCMEGHTWYSKAQNVKSLRRWCPTCGRIKSDLNRRKFNITDLKDFAISKGGKCLSDKFTGVDKKYKWECAKGHTWEASFHKIKNGKNWCPTCAAINRSKKRIKHTITDLSNYAKQKGGECLSDTFANIKSKYLWQCDQGHQWYAVADNVINSNKWCPFCAPNYIGNIDEMFQIAKQRGGKCLSSSYKNTNHKLEWECSEGHKWKAIPSLIKRGAWCPICSQGIGERICREFFEQLLKTKFEKVRPGWLKTQEGNWMELDGYSDKLKIAFEHQGIQHYKNLKHFYSEKPEKFEQTQQRDKLKLQLCNNNGVLLIQIPSILDILGIENVRSFIKAELLKNGFETPTDFDKVEIDLSKIYIIDKLDELRKIAEQKGGILLSTQYHGIFEPLEWECEKGHKWSTPANQIKNNDTWCPYCIGRHKTIDDMQLLASKFEGLCLSDKYINNNTHLLWQCKLGHKFKSKPANVYSGYWCPICGRLKASLSRRKYSIGDMQKLAESKNGKCLSTEYLGYKTKLDWECENGHQWSASPEIMIRNNKWCKECKKLTSANQVNLPSGK